MSRIEPQDVEKMKTLGDVKGLIEAALGYWNDSMVRESAARALGRIGDPRAVEPLIAALKEEDGRSSAARAPGEIGDARAVEPLIFALKDEDIGVRSAAAKALDEIGIPAS
jgi:HEAT repeat protein